MLKSLSRLTGSLLLLLLLIATPKPALAQTCSWGGWSPWHQLGAWTIETGVESGWGTTNYWDGTGCTQFIWAIQGETDEPTVSYEVWIDAKGWDICGGDAFWTQEIDAGIGDVNNTDHADTQPTSGPFLDCRTGHTYSIDGHSWVLIRQGDANWWGGYGCWQSSELPC
jgi:hypothetical protein